MSSFEKKIEEFAQQVIELHGFRFSEGFSCLIPDKEEFPSNEGLFLWGLSKKRMRFETKIEKFHTSTRIKRMEAMLKSEKDYKRLFTAIENYLKSLKEIGFKNIGKGVNLFERAKVYNVQADVLQFEKNLDALKKLELITINNPVIKFAEERNYFKVKNRQKLAYDSNFSVASKASDRYAKPATKGKPAATKAKSAATKAKSATTKTKSADYTKPVAAVAKPVAAVAKPVATKAAAKAKPSSAEAKSSTTAKKAPALPSSTPKLPTTIPFAEKLKKLATNQPESSLDGDAKRNAWTKQVNSLYKKVQNWLSDHVKNDYITFNVRNIKLVEENLGTYEMDSLELELVGGHQVIFQPVEMNILDSVGRVDVFHRGDKPHKVMLLLGNEGKNKFSWELWKGFKKEEQLSFNRESLEALLNQWIES